jgi:hypothetical protein
LCGGDGGLLDLGLGFNGATNGIDLIVAEIGAMALALDAQVLFEGVEHIVIAHAKLFG